MIMILIRYKLWERPTTDCTAAALLRDLSVFIREGLLVDPSQSCISRFLRISHGFPERPLSFFPC